MKKIYIVIAGAFLILLIITSILLSLGKKSSTNTQKNSPFPTSVPSSPSSISLSPNPLPNPTSTLVNISTIVPVETADFKLQYSPRLQKIIVEKKTLQAEEQFINWAKQNQLTPLINNQNQILIVDQGKNPDDFNPVIDFLNIFINLGQGNGSSTGQSNSSTTNSNTLTISTPVPTESLAKGRFAYFPQCGDFGSLSLPDGCNLCNAGCGPTTVSMIASSYLGPKYDPKTVVDLYKTNGYLLGCDGSRYSDAHELLKQLGLKTTDYLVFDSEKADTVVPDLRKYLNAGWTFFTLASFCTEGCGHYFWITDIDSQGNIFAYDPAYGRYEIPYNENSRYPYPLYRLVFGVKK